MPHFREISRYVCGNMHLVLVDVDRFDDLADEHNIEGLPTFIVFQNGKLLRRVEGYHEAEDLLKFAQG